MEDSPATDKAHNMASFGVGSGNFHWNAADAVKSIVCMTLSDPCLTGYTQTINDWYNREINAINELYCPIPSGAISENEVITRVWVLLLVGLGLAGLLDVWAGHDFLIVFYLAVGRSLILYSDSVPPLKLKQNEWIRNFALGASYISLPWWAGQALFGTITLDIVVFILLYTISGLGIAIVNDFKSIEGDRKMGLQFQYFLKDPAKYDVRYQAGAQLFLTLGLLVTALATSH